MKNETTHTPGRGGARKGAGRKAKAPRAKYTVNVNHSDLNVARQRHGKLVQRYCVDLIKCLADTPADHKIEFSIVAKEGEEYF